MPRAPFKPVELTEALRPVAAPVDSFVQAQVPSRDNNLQDLARSLSGLGGSLAGLVGQRDKQAEEEDAIRGKAAYYQSNQQGFAEGVSSGAIPAQASKSFMQAYKKAEGEVAGGVLEQKFAAAYDTWEGKTNADPAAFSTFLGDFLKQNIGTNDPDVLRGVLPKVEQLRANYLQRHIGDVSKATMQGAIDAASAKDSQAIDAANTAGLSSEKGTDYQGVFGQIEANRAASLKVGMDRAKYDEKVVDNITALAIKNRDVRLLDFLSRKVPGTDYSWDAAPYGRDQKQKAIDTLETMGRRSIADDEKKRREEKADLKDAVTRETIQAITKAPNDPIPEALLARGEKVDPDFRVNAIRWRDTIGKGTTTSDPQEILGVTADILNGGGLQRVQRAMRDGVFKNASDLTTAWKLAEGMAKDGGKLDAITKLQSFKDLTATIKVRTGGEKDPFALFDDGSFTAEGLQAMTDLRRQALQWAQEHPNAGPIEQEEAVAKFGADILKRVPDRTATAVPFYNRDGSETPNAFGAKPAMQMPVETQAPRAAPATPQGPAYGNRDVQVPSGLPGGPEAAPSSPAQAAPAAAAARPTPQASQPEAVSAWLNALPPEMRSRLEVKAAEERKPLLLKAQEVYERGVAAGAIKAPAAPATVPTPAQPPAPGRQTMKAPDGTPIESASAVGPEADAAARDVMAAFQRSAGPAVSREQAAKAPRVEGGAPPTPIPASLITEKGPTPVPANSAVAVVDDGPRGHINHGVISLKGPDGSILGQYRFVNGGGGNGSIPHGAYDVTNFRDTATRKAQGLGNLGETFDLSDVFDARAGRDRTALRIHQAHGNGTLGCIGIQGGEAAWQDFSKKMQGLVAQGGGKYTLVLGSETGSTGPAGQTQGGDAQAAFTRALSSTAKPSTFASPEVQADPRAARILDMVSGAELKGANPGNYNAVYGNAAATEDLSKRTLDQTISWSRNRGTASSATGRFQFMADTLESLKKDLKLTGSEAFTPALQDRMALALLNRRGYREWSTGKLSTEDFAANLAKEWASLPNLTDGKSQYAGDGRNKALISPAQLRAALTGTGAFPGAALEAAGKAAIAKPSVFERVRGMFGGGSASAAGPAVDAYSNAPKPEVAERLRAISPNPVASSDAVLAEVAPNLASAIRKAQADNPKLRIVVVARSGEGAEVWPVDARGRVSFDPAQQDAVGAAVRRSASQLGFGVNILGGTGGGLTHIEMAPTSRA